MQIVVSQCTRLARIYIEYLDVQHRQVISACTAAEGDVWCVLPLFLHFIRIREIHQSSRPTTVCHLFRCFDEPLIECPDIGGVWIEMEGGNDGIRFLVGATWCHSVCLLAPMWSTLANSYWPAARCCNLRCAHLKKLFRHINRWLPLLLQASDANRAINPVSGWCNLNYMMQYPLDVWSNFIYMAVYQLINSVRQLNQLDLRFLQTL